MPRLPMPTTRTLYLFMPSLPRVLRVPLLRLGDHIIDLISCQLGENRETHATGGVGLGIGQAADDSGAFAPRVAGLLMYRYRVMGFGIDVVLHKEVDHRVAPLGFFRFHDVQMEYMAVPGQLHG